MEVTDGPSAAPFVLQMASASLSNSTSSISNEQPAPPSFTTKSVSISIVLDLEKQKYHGKATFQDIAFEDGSTRQIGLYASRSMRILRVANLYGNAISWHWSDNRFASTTEAVVQYWRRIYEHATSEPPNLLLDLSSRTDSSGFLVEWDADCDDGAGISVQHEVLQISAMLGWFPCPKCVSSAWSLDVSLRNAPPIDLTHLNLISSIGPATRDACEFSVSSALPSRALSFVLGHFQSLPIACIPRSLLWVSPKLADRTRSFLDFIEQSTGFAAWYLNLPSVGIEGLSLVFARQLDEFTCQSFAVLPSELLAGDREVDCHMLLRRKWAEAVFKLCFTRMASSDPFLIAAICRYLSLCLLRIFHGDNDMRWQLWDLANMVTRLDDLHHDWSIYPHHSYALVDQAFEEYAIAKLTVLIHMLHDRIAKTPTTLRHVFAHIHETSMELHVSEPLTHRHFLRIIKQLTGLDFRSLWDQTTCAQKGGLRKSISYSFNRKKMVLELDIVDDIATDDTQPSRAPLPLSIRVQEINNNVYEHTVQVVCDTPRQHIDIPVHCKIRKPHRRRRRKVVGEDGEAEFVEHSFQEGSEEKREEVILTPPIKWIRPDSHWGWPLARLVINQPDYMCCALLLKDGIGDVRSQVYALQLLSQMTSRRPGGHGDTFNVLDRLILDQKSIWQVRCEAVRVYCDVGPAAFHRVTSVLARKFGVQEGDAFRMPLRANNFAAKLSDYFVQRAFARYLPSCIPSDSELTLETFLLALQVACSIVQLESDFLRFNDNSSSENVVSDSRWLADVLEALGLALDRMFSIISYVLTRPPAASPVESEEEGFESFFMTATAVPKTKKPVQPSLPAIDWQAVLSCVGHSVQQVERYVTREHMLPSHQNVIMRAIIRGPWSVLLQHTLPLSQLAIDRRLRSTMEAALNGIPGLLTRYSGERSFWRVRLAAMESQIAFAAVFVRLKKPEGWDVYYEALGAIGRRSFTLLMRRSLMTAIVESLVNLGPLAAENAELREHLIRAFESIHDDRKLCLTMLRAFMQLYNQAADDELLPSIKLPSIAVEETTAPVTQTVAAIPKVRLSVNVPETTQQTSAIPRIQLKPPPKQGENTIDTASSAPASPPKAAASTHQTSTEGSPLKVKLRLRF